MNVKDAARWLTWSKGRLLTTVTAVAATCAVLVVVVLASRVASLQTVASSLRAEETTSATTGPGPTPSATAATTEAVGPATAFLRAWLSNDPSYAGVAHPDLVAALAEPDAPSRDGLVLTGDGTVAGFATEDMVPVEFPTNRGPVVVTMMRTEEAGWLAREMVVSS